MGLNMMEDCVGRIIDAVRRMKDISPANAPSLIKASIRPIVRSVADSEDHGRRLNLLFFSMAFPHVSPSEPAPHLPVVPLEFYLHVIATFDWIPHFLELCHLFSRPHLVEIFEKLLSTLNEGEPPSALFPRRYLLICEFLLQQDLALTPETPREERMSQAATTTLFSRFAPPDVLEVFSRVLPSVEGHPPGRRMVDRIREYVLAGKVRKELIAKLVLNHFFKTESAGLGLFLLSFPPSPATRLTSLLGLSSGDFVSQSQRDLFVRMTKSLLLLAGGRLFPEVIRLVGRFVAGNAWLGRADLLWIFQRVGDVLREVPPDGWVPLLELFDACPLGFQALFEAFRASPPEVPPFCGRLTHDPLDVTEHGKPARSHAFTRWSFFVSYQQTAARVAKCFLEPKPAIKPKNICRYFSDKSIVDKFPPALADSRIEDSLLAERMDLLFASEDVAEVFLVGAVEPLISDFSWARPLPLSLSTLTVLTCFCDHSGSRGDLTAGVLRFLAVLLDSTHFLFGEGGALLADPCPVWAVKKKLLDCLVRLGGSPNRAAIGRTVLDVLNRECLGTLTHFYVRKMLGVCSAPVRSDEMRGVALLSHVVNLARSECVDSLGVTNPDYSQLVFAASCISVHCTAREFGSVVDFATLLIVGSTDSSNDLISAARFSAYSTFLCHLMTVIISNLSSLPQYRRQMVSYYVSLIRKRLEDDFLPNDKVRGVLLEEVRYQLGNVMASLMDRNCDEYNVIGSLLFHVEQDIDAISQIPTIL